MESLLPTHPLIMGDDGEARHPPVVCTDDGLADQLVFGLKGHRAEKRDTSRCGCGPLVFLLHAGNAQCSPLFCISFVVLTQCRL